MKHSGKQTRQQRPTYVLLLYAVVIRHVTRPPRALLNHTTHPFLPASSYHAATSHLLLRLRIITAVLNLLSLLTDTLIKIFSISMSAWHCTDWLAMMLECGLGRALPPHFTQHLVRVVHVP